MKHKLSLYLLLTVFSLRYIVGVAVAAPIEFSLEAGNRFLRAGASQTVPLKLSLEGTKLAIRERAPANVAIVIDRSGSMSGGKLEKAKDGAIAAISMLSKDDIISVIAYDTSAQVVVPATRLTNPETVKRKIRAIGIGGSTALYAGVSFGAEELRKFLTDGQVNRVVLLSDGIANVGPSSPSDLAGLGSSLAKEGITVSTIGLGAGYNEDLMQQLADRSDGNHVFAEQATDLLAMFQREFDDLLSVVAQNVDVRIRCASGVRPVRVLGRDAEIIGNEVIVRMNNLYSGHEKYVLLEVEVEPGADGTTSQLAEATVSYSDIQTKQRRTQVAASSVSFTRSEVQLTRYVNKPTMEAYYIQVANLANDEVIRLRDLGKTKEAKALLATNSRQLEQQSADYNLPALKKQAEFYDRQILDLDSRSWEVQRKSMKGFSHFNKSQQTYQGK